MKIIILSGGLDSTILTYKLVKEFGSENIIALTFDYKQKHKIELNKASITCTKLKIDHRIIDIGFLGDINKEFSALSKDSIIKMPEIKDVLGHPQPKTYVAYRNLILLSIGLSFAETNGADEIYTGLQCHDLYSYWDTSNDFINALNNVSLLNRMHKILIKAPFINMSKKEEILIGQKLNVPFIDSFTCYNPTTDNKACGKCPACAERIQNFILAKIKDPVPYDINIDWNKYIKR